MTAASLVLSQAAMELHRPQTAVEIRAQVNLIQEVMKGVMKENVHFGTIPGTPKPTLYKAGAEKILTTFRIAIDPQVDDLSNHDEARYRVYAKATSMISGAHIGVGVGECSSNEEKYRWRAAVSDKEFDATPEDRRRIKYFKNGNEAKQIRTNHADIANTVLKMAKKRALIDVTLTATAASDVFSQDIEDLPEEVRDAIVREESPRSSEHSVPPPQRRSQQTTQSAPAPAGDLAAGHTEIARILDKIFQGDAESAANLLESITENKEKGWPGKRDPKKLTEAGVKFVLPKLRDREAAFDEEMAGAEL